MKPIERVRPEDVTSETECHREPVLDLDAIFSMDAGLPPDRPRGGWTCTVSLFTLEDDYALNQEVETEIAFLTYHIGDDDVCELVDMEVAEEFRGQGLGKRLVGEALADIHIKGGTRVYIFAYEPDEGSKMKFFSTFGFSPLEVPDGEASSKSLPNPMVLELETDG